MVCVMVARLKEVDMWTIESLTPGQFVAGVALIVVGGLLYGLVCGLVEARVWRRLRRLDAEQVALNEARRRLDEKIRHEYRFEQEEANRGRD